jgi:hypothetical protein
MEQSRKDINQLLDEAVDLTEGHLSYTNNVRFNASNNEVFIDFFRASPHPKNINEPYVERIYRVVMPLGVGKDFAQKLLSVISLWEDKFGVNLPFETIEEE